MVLSEWGVRYAGGDKLLGVHSRTAPDVPYVRAYHLLRGSLAAHGYHSGVPLDNKS